MKLPSSVQISFPLQKIGTITETISEHKYIDHVILENPAPMNASKNPSSCVNDSGNNSLDRAKDYQRRNIRKCDVKVSPGSDCINNQHAMVGQGTFMDSYI